MTVHGPRRLYVENALIDRYDLILTYGGGDPVVRAYEALSAARCLPTYNPVDPETHYPVSPTVTDKPRLTRTEIGIATGPAGPIG